MDDYPEIQVDPIARDLYDLVDSAVVAESIHNRANPDMASLLVALRGISDRVQSLIAQVERVDQ